MNLDDSPGRRLGATQHLLGAPVASTGAGTVPALPTVGVAGAEWYLRLSPITFAVVSDIGDFKPPSRWLTPGVVILGRGCPLQPNVRQLWILCADIVFQLSE